MQSSTAIQFPLRASSNLNYRDDAVISVSFDGLVLSWNRGAEKLFQYSTNEILNRPILSVISPSNRELFLDQLRQLYDHKPVQSLKIQYFPRSGEPFWAWTNIRCLLDPNGYPTTVSLACKKLPKSALNLMESNEALDSIYGYIHGLNDYRLVYTFDTNGKILTWSREGEAINQYKPEDVIGQDIKILYPPDIVQNHKHLEILKHASKQEGWETHQWQIKKNNSRFWAHIVTIPIYDKEKNVTGFTQAVRDMTDSKKAWDALAHNQFKTLIENSMDLIMVVDRNGLIFFTNPAVENILGYTPSSCIGRNALSWVHPGDMPVVIDELMKIKNDPSRNASFEFRMQHKDKSWRTLQVIGRSFLKNSTSAAIVINGRDVTKIKELEDQVLKAVEEERNRFASELHDGLTQELAGIEFLSRSLQQSLDNKNKKEKNLAQKISNYLNQAIKKTRDLSHQIYPMGLKVGLVQALELLTENIEKLYSANCRLDVSQNLPELSSESENHCYYIIQEAVKNAIRHGQATRIQVQVIHQINQIIISVRDNGIFINKPGNTLKKGIGLRLMLHRARMINGTLDLHQNISGGLTVICTFPYSIKIPIKKGAHHDKKRKKIII